MKASSFTKSPDHLAHGARILFFFICSGVFFCWMACWTTAEVSFSIFVNARTSSRFEIAPCPGITFTSDGS